MTVLSIVTYNQKSNAKLKVFGTRYIIYLLHALTKESKKVHFTEGVEADQVCPDTDAKNPREHVELEGGLRGESLSMLLEHISPTRTLTLLNSKKDTENMFDISVSDMCPTRHGFMTEMPM